MESTKAIYRILPSSVALFLVLALHAFAANGTWTSTSSAAWNTAAPWSGGNIADGSGFTANFSTINATSDITVTLGVDRVIGSLTFGDADTTSAAGWTVTGNTLNPAGGALTVTVNALGTGKKTGISSIIAGDLTKAGGGTLVLGAANTYSGTTSITGGTLEVSNAALIPNTSGISIGSAGIFAVTAAPTGNWTPTVSGTGVWNLNGSTSSWTRFTGIVSGFTGTLNIGSGIGVYGSSATNYPGAGAIINIASGGELNFGGGGTAFTTAAGTINLHGGTGPSWDNTGVALRTLNSSVVSQNINVLASTTIGCLGGQGGGSYVGTVTINPATTLTVKTPANLTISGGLSGSGTLTTSSGGNTYRLFLGGDNSNFAGTILPGPASLITFTSASAGSSAATFQAGHAGGNLAFLEWGGSSSATVKLGALTDGGYSTGYVQNQNPSNNTTGTFEIGSLGTDTTFSGTIRDSYAAGNSKSAITKVGSGILTLTGTATHTGGTTITSGTLRLGNGTSSNGTLTGPVTNNATFMVANPSDQSLISPIGGSGGLVKSGAGTLTLSGQNTYLGPTTITQGTLRLAASQILLPSNLDVMPTGDSITFGANGGYRSPLFSSIQAIAPGFHFVGDSTLNPGTLPAGQQNHAGHSSYSSIDIHNNLDGLDLTTFNTYGDASRNPNGGFWLTGRTADANGPARDPLYPDVILLLVGANDIFRLTMNAQQAHDSYTALLTKITTLRPDAHVFMAKITPHANATQNQKAIAYNAVVAQVYDEFKAAGKNVTLVDLHTGYTGGLPDSLHPDAAGYAWMAGKWRDALVSALGIASVVTTALPAASSVTVAAGATLDLNHTEASIAGLNVSGTVSLGSGKLSTAAPASFAAGSALATRINRDNQTAGRLAVTGNLTLGNAALNLAITGTAALNPDTKFTLASYTGNLAGTFNGLPEGGVLTVSGTPFILRYADGGKNITLTVTTPYQSWISTQHPALTGNDCQPIADPDGDGLVNLIEYALGLNPQIANPNPIQFDKESVGADTYLRLSVARDPDASGVLIEGQVAETLAPGSWSSESVVIELTPPTEFRVRDSVPMSASSRRFMRLRFSQQ